jgi:hypothetical protein
MESNSIFSGFYATSTTSKLVVISAVLPSMMLAEQRNHWAALSVKQVLRSLFESFDCLREHVHMGMRGVQSHVQGLGTVNVFMHHQVSQLAHGQPIVGAIDESQALSTVQIFKNSANPLLHGFEPGGQQFVTQQILQTTKSSDKSVDTF